MKATVRARANIALIKYWGKADVALNVPAVGSLSITLDSLWSETEVEFDTGLSSDMFSLNGQVRRERNGRVTECLNLLRSHAGVESFAKVLSRNNFPTSAGLASSASGFAALTAAAAHALDLDLTPRDLSIIARQGSGSAARSIFGGFVEMHAGSMADGSDSFAEPLFDAEAWPLEVVIAITERGEKAVSSRAGMEQSAASSPYYSDWVASSAQDLACAQQAVLNKDFETLARVAEHNCLKMHAAAMAAQPPLIYWNAATVASLHAVRALRASGVAVFFTIDAGPQLKAVCAPGASGHVEAVLRAVPGVLDTLVSGLGPGVEAV